MNHKLNLKKQLACIYTNNFFSGLRITDAVWVALLAARGFSLWEIGVAESVFHMVSLTFEVPSGMAPFRSARSCSRALPRPRSRWSGA